MSNNLKNDILNTALEAYIPEHRMKLSNEDIIKLVRANSMADTDFPDTEDSDAHEACTPEKNAFGLMGWICPVCGRGLSPYTDSCPCVVNWEITCGTGTAALQHGEIISHIHQVYQDNVSVNTTPVFKPPREEKYNV